LIVKSGIESVVAIDVYDGFEKVADYLADNGVEVALIEKG
jgi:hypothetical protein